MVINLFFCQLSLYPRWYFAVISVSGVFAVTFSVVFAYVADITQEHERSMAYGLVCVFILFFVSVKKTTFLNYFILQRVQAFALQKRFFFA